MITFSDRFKRARERSGLSQVKLAEQIGVSTQAVWNYENRPDGGVAVDLLFPIADLLNVEARWLATGDGVMYDGETPLLHTQRVQKVAQSIAVLTDEKLVALSVLLGVKL